MDSETEDLYLQKLEEFVYDEDKIVTVRWLSIFLSINAKDAKHLLQKYFLDQRTINPDALGVTYILSGMIEEAILSICVVKEEELEHKKDELIKVLSQQINSIQKSKQVDLTAVSLVDYFDTRHPQEKPVLGSLISKKCVKRVFTQKKPLPPPPPPMLKGKSSFFMKKTDSSSSVKEESSSPVRRDNTNQSKPASKGNFKPKQNGIANFFAKASCKIETKCTNVDNNKSEKAKATEEPKIKEEPKLEEAEHEQDIQSKISSLVDNDSDAENIISPTPKPNLEKKQPKPRQKRQKKDNDNMPNPKRRKRIVQHNDSDSDDIFGDDIVKEDIVESSDEEPKLVIKQPLAPKNKKRKQVTQTFEDEAGYIVTRKTWVEESGSEDETKAAEPESKKPKPEPKLQEAKQEFQETSNIEKEAHNNKAINGKGKGAKNKKLVAANQKTLMSFFTKK